MSYNYHAQNSLFGGEMCIGSEAFHELFGVKILIPRP